MGTRALRSFFGHYAVCLAAASLISFMLTSCAAQYHADGLSRRPPPARSLAFENATTEPVSVYLEERGSQWFVGYVLPGARADLRLPSVASNPAGREFTLVVVPASARRGVSLRSRAAFPGPITAEQLRGDYLTNVQWRLTGNWLVPLPIPRRP
jgi:hypothetical protein